MRKAFLSSIIAVILLGALAASQYFYFNDGKLHVIFCDVGQGDAILIKTPTNKRILVDGGPDRKVLACLSRHMPFWERDIDIMLLTHPHADHFMGMFYVIDRYNIKSFATEKLDNKSDSFQEFMGEVRARNMSVNYVLAGDKWRFPMEDELIISIKSPTEDFLKRTSPTGEVGESKEFASLITHVRYDSFDVLLTGDSQIGALSEAVDKMGKHLEVLQTPHHGSATGLTRAFLKKQHPELTIISVGAKNRYGHPSKDILESLRAQDIPFFRTDERGDIEIVSDGKGFVVKK